jgi:hypothetical protein
MIMEARMVKLEAAFLSPPPRTVGGAMAAAMIAAKEADRLIVEAVEHPTRENWWSAYEATLVASAAWQNSMMPVREALLAWARRDPPDKTDPRD